MVREPGSEVHLGVTRNFNLAQGVLRLAGGKAEAQLSGVLAVLAPQSETVRLWEIDKDMGE